MSGGQAPIRSNRRLLASIIARLRRVPLSIGLSLLSALLAYIFGVSRLAIGLLAGIPVAMCHRYFTGRGLKQISQNNSIAGVSAVFNWSLLRLLLVAAAFMAARPFGPYVLLGVFIAIVFEMGAYIGRVWLMINKSSG